MGFSREETIDGWFAEWKALGELLRSRTPEDWRAPTRCEGWEVRDVAGYAVGVAVDVAAGRPTRSTPDQQAAQW
jgi:uncharacterized protein (TIGR03083 family)